MKKKKTVLISEERGMEIVRLLRSEAGAYAKLSRESTIYKEENFKECLRYQRWADDLQRQLGRL